jgi:tRNA (guanine37-N1)-methyltransferase
VNAINLRDFADDKHQKVDDTTYGGGAGMILKPEPIYKALKSIKSLKSKVHKVSKMTILLSPRGKQFDQRMAEKLSKMKEITFVCGRYEGVDQRVADYMVDEEISIGPYVLAGGELGALVMIESVSRLLKGVLGNEESLVEETFNNGTWNMEHGTSVEYGQYTKPADFKGMKVPEILLSGNHGEIEKWRKTDFKNQDTRNKQIKNINI